MGNSLTPRIQNAEKTGVLQLAGQKLANVPDVVKTLQNLRNLDISSNRITILKLWNENLKTLKALDVQGNKLSFLPVELCQMPKLETLNASHNCLSRFFPPGPPVNVSPFRSLRTVLLAHNKLTEFPVELCSASTPMNFIDLSHNQISVVPNCISTSQVIELNLDDNKIASISESIAECPRLKILRIEYNQLSLQAFPAALFTRSSVSLITVEHNLFVMRDFYALDGYDQYMERYTAVKKKAI